MATCPQCQTMAPESMRFCQRCGTRLAEPAPWTEHRDAWRGFRVQHPVGWRVVSSALGTLVDGGGLTRAYFLPLHVAATPEAASGPVVQALRRLSPSLRVYRMPDMGTDREVFSTTVQGGMGRLTLTKVSDGLLVQGYVVPEGAQGAEADVERVLQSVTGLEPVARGTWTEPAEGAFLVDLPTGWQMQGGVRRTGFPEPWFEASHGAWRVHNAMYPPAQYTEAAGAFGMRQNVHSYQTAQQWTQQAMWPLVLRTHPEARVLEFRPLPELEAGLQAAMQASGIRARVSLGELRGRWMEGQMPMTDLSLVRTLWFPSPVPGMPGTWTGSVVWTLRAPEGQLDELEPIGRGVLQSFRLHPRWSNAILQGQVQQLQATHQHVLNTQAQINQSMQQTAQMQRDSFQRQQAMQADQHHRFTNVLLGQQDVRGPGGEVYSVASGYNRYFRDGYGTFHGGSALSGPQVGWTEYFPID